MKSFTADDYLDGLRDIGWMKALPPGERKALARDLRAIFRKKKVETLPSAELFLVLSVTSFDTEMINGDGPDEPCSYHSVIEQLAKASFGKFKPKKIFDELDEKKETASIAFELAKKRFAIVVPYTSDWFDGAVIDDLVNGALADRKIPHRFQLLPAVDQCANLAFVPDAAWRKALDREIVPSQDDVFALYPMY